MADSLRHTGQGCGFALLYPGFFTPPRGAELMGPSESFPSEQKLPGHRMLVTVVIWMRTAPRGPLFECLVPS